MSNAIIDMAMTYNKSKYQHNYITVQRAVTWLFGGTPRRTEISTVPCQNQRVIPTVCNEKKGHMYVQDITTSTF